MGEITPQEMQESLNRLLKSHSCTFAKWMDDNLYTQDEESKLWFNVPTQNESRMKTLEELYDQHLSEKK